MNRRCLRGCLEVLVQSGRAPRGTGRQVYRRPVTVTAIVVLSVLGGVTFAQPAYAHGRSEPEIAAVFDRSTPEMPGVTVSVNTTTLGSQLVLENPTPTEVTILSAVGDPLFKIGPGGVLGNFRSPDWYTSKVAGGEVTIPDKAADHGRAVWVRVSRQPDWGWFDHRLHSGEFTPEQKAAVHPLAWVGTWNVPLLFGDRAGAIEGHFEYRPLLGTFTPQLSTSHPAPGVTLTALPGNPTPAIAVDNSSPTDVVVLGDEDEPFLRITPNGTLANQHSPTWMAAQHLTAPAGADPPATPQWVPVGATAQYTFTVARAGPDRNLAALYALHSPTDVRDWTISLLIDNRRVDVTGKTIMTPASYHGDGTRWWTIATISAVTILVAAGVLLWILRRRRSTAQRKAATQTTKRTKIHAGP
jgi:hypothetical protein